MVLQQVCRTKFFHSIVNTLCTNVRSSGSKVTNTCERAKTLLRHMSKYLDVKTATKLNQWKNTDEVITWFNNVENKQNNAFICFDVCEFYPSITEELLDKALDFAKTTPQSQILM